MLMFTLGEINIICTNLDRTLHFYRDILGFEPTTDDEGFYHMRFGGKSFLLLPTAQQQAPAAAYETVAQFSMDLNVDDLEAAYTYLQQQGVTIAKPWQPGDAMFVIRDPDGLPWEVVGPV